MNVPNDTLDALATVAFVTNGRSSRPDAARTALIRIVTGWLVNAWTAKSRLRDAPSRHAAVWFQLQPGRRAHHAPGCSERNE